MAELRVAGLGLDEVPGTISGTNRWVMDLAMSMLLSAVAGSIAIIPLSPIRQDARGVRKMANLGCFQGAFARGTPTFRIDFN